MSEEHDLGATDQSAHNAILFTSATLIPTLMSNEAEISPVF